MLIQDKVKITCKNCNNVVVVTDKSDSQSDINKCFVCKGEDFERIVIPATEEIAEYYK